jgi:hypothetical protein
VHDLNSFWFGGWEVGRWKIYKKIKKEVVVVVGRM